MGRDPHAGPRVPGPGSCTSYSPPSGCRGQVQKGHTWPPLSLADLGPSQVKVFSFPFMDQCCPCHSLHCTKTTHPREATHAHRGQTSLCNWLPLPWDSLGCQEEPWVTDASSLKGDQLSSNPRVPRPPKFGCCDCLCCLQLPGFVQITKNDHKSQVLCRASC